ncbi:MAG: hypothetical protein OQK73_08495 [Gammaproteobacteria bacterium]|nr:hypothetical protein [Gammaproteobacteria bacterium]
MFIFKLKAQASTSNTKYSIGSIYDLIVFIYEGDYNDAENKLTQKLAQDGWDKAEIISVKNYKGPISKLSQSLSEPAHAAEQNGYAIIVYK